METCHFSLFSWHILFIIFGFQHSDKEYFSHGVGLLLPPAISLPFVASVFTCGQSCPRLDCHAMETSVQSSQALLTLLIIRKGMSQQAVLTPGEMELDLEWSFPPPPQLLPLIPPVPKMSRGEMFCSLKTEASSTISHQEPRGALHRNQVIVLEYLSLWIRSSISIYLLALGWWTMEGQAFQNAISFQVLEEQIGWKGVGSLGGLQHGLLCGYLQQL